MSRTSYVAIFVACIACNSTLPALATEPPAKPGVHIDVPVVLKQAKVVFSMNHAAFSGDTPVGLKHMRLMSERFKSVSADLKVVAVFYGEAGYMLLNDKKYNAVRKTETGNPYKALIKDLADQGVEIEECVVTMQAKRLDQRQPASRRESQCRG